MHEKTYVREVVEKHNTYIEPFIKIGCLRLNLSFFFPFFSNLEFKFFIYKFSAFPIKVTWELEYYIITN